MAQVDEQDTTRATNDAYTGMLAISLIALIAGCALLFLDWNQYPDKDPPKVKAPTPSLVAPPPAAKDGGAQPPPAPAPAPMLPMGNQPMPEKK